MSKGTAENQKIEQIKYCLYARKSSESDERQTMSIDSQIKEMTELAERDGHVVVEIKKESHSAKASGMRPVFMEIMKEIREDKYNGILTWAADRLSRNAGDLGSLVDLMDQGKLQKIQTYSQGFSNNPNEKFLLMILCSQAKLENDNRGVNVKRGLKAKCEMGIRPGYAPLGYMNLIKNDRIREIIIDEDRAPIVKEMFERVGRHGQSGRVIKRWLDSIDFRTKKGVPMVLSSIYRTLQNSFYYGEFEFGGKYYKGGHIPLITKELFDEVQKQLIVPPKTWNKKQFPFKTLCKCGKCGDSIIGEDKYKKTKGGGFNKYTYYHCTRSVDFECDEPYLREEELISQLIKYVERDEVEFKQKKLNERLVQDVEKFHRLRTDVLHQQYIAGHLKQFDRPESGKFNDQMAKDYVLHVLKMGTSEERMEVMSMIKTRFLLSEKQLFRRDAV
ncbi:MAG: recombinase family protein [Pseudomonadales bacterium]|jgi:DNA invertase Pin-like site-specific DNA recombinase|nr:recombinase family protein [Pseudomonadales bacterium]